MDDLPYWLLLLKAPLVGARTFYQAIEYFESPDNVFTSTETRRAQSGIFKAKTLEWFKTASLSLVDDQMRWLNSEQDCHILTLIDKSYPSLIKEIDAPPPILYVRGCLSVLNKPQIGIVGSRNPSPAGLEYTQIITQQLASAGLTITSGLATGIDAQAHISAIKHQTTTIAVCGTGLDRVYPAKHKNLAHQITQNGALVSEFPIGTAPIAGNFPKRNRLISGLSLGVLVTEAQQKSGSLITARLALEQGREVFAMPSSVFNLSAKGCHQLIKQGAVLVEDINDILDNISVPTNTVLNQVSEKIDDKNSTTSNNILLKYLTYTPTNIDTLLEKTGLSVGEVEQLLLELELSGEVYHTKNSGFSLK